MFREFVVSGFRGFETLRVSPLERFNLVLGRNNVGKTAFLEAIYLLCGPTNPELPLRINAFRGISQFVINDVEEVWGWLFHGKDMEQTITCEGLLSGSTHKRRSLDISLADPISTRKGKSSRKQLSVNTEETSSSRISLPSELRLLYRSETNTTAETRAILRDDSVKFERSKTVKVPNSIFLTAKAGYSAENPKRFSKLAEDGREEEVVDHLRAIDKRLKRLAVLVTGMGPVIHADIGLGRMVPIPFMGDGMGKLLTLLLSIAECKRGILLVDEIEAGLHHSVMTKVWQTIATAARMNDTQVIATTHSWECLRSAQEAFAEVDPYDLVVHRLDRVGERVEVESFDQEALDVAIHAGMELR